MENRVLRDVRRQAGLTQRELADLVGLNHSRVSQVESGRGSFASTTWVALSEEPAIQKAMRSLRVTLNDLISGSKAAA